MKKLVLTFCISIAFAGPWVPLQARIAYRPLLLGLCLMITPELAGCQSNFQSSQNATPAQESVLRQPRPMQTIRWIMKSKEQPEENQTWENFPVDSISFSNLRKKTNLDEGRWELTFSYQVILSFGTVSGRMTLPDTTDLAKTLDNLSDLNVDFDENDISQMAIEDLVLLLGSGEVNSFNLHREAQLHPVMLMSYNGLLNYAQHADVNSFRPLLIDADDRALLENAVAIGFSRNLSSNPDLEDPNSTGLSLVIKNHDETTEEHPLKIGEFNDELGNTLYFFYFSE